MYIQILKIKYPAKHRTTAPSPVLIKVIVTVVDRVKAPFLWRPCDHDRVIEVQLPPSSYTLLRPWIRRFTMIISAYWLRTSSKLSDKKSNK